MIEQAGVEIEPACTTSTRSMSAQRRIDGSRAASTAAYSAARFGRDGEDYLDDWALFPAGRTSRSSSRRPSPQATPSSGSTSPGGPCGRWRAVPGGPARKTTSRSPWPVGIVSNNEIIVDPDGYGHHRGRPGRDTSRSKPLLVTSVELTAAGGGLPLTADACLVDEQLTHAMPAGRRQQDQHIGFPVDKRKIIALVRNLGQTVITSPRRVGGGAKSSRHGMGQFELTRPLDKHWSVQWPAPPVLP